MGGRGAMVLCLNYNEGGYKFAVKLCKVIVNVTHQAIQHLIKNST